MMVLDVDRVGRTRGPERQRGWSLVSLSVREHNHSKCAIRWQIQRFDTRPDEAPGEPIISAVRRETSFSLFSAIPHLGISKAHISLYIELILNLMSVQLEGTILPKVFGF